MAQLYRSWINSSSSFIGLVIPMVSFGTVTAILSFLFPLSSSYLLTMNMECYETPITDISVIVEETRVAFKFRKTLSIAFRKGQLRQFWKMVDVRGTRTQRLRGRSVAIWRPQIQFRMELIWSSNLIPRRLFG